MKKFIVIKTQFEGIHRWPEAKHPVEFLKHPHRHMFHVTVKWEVAHNDRELEFITLKREVTEWVNKGANFSIDLGRNSCEDLAEQILKKFGADYVSVFEDGENGAEIYK